MALPSFKDIIQSDIQNVFFGPEEIFCEKHTVNGREMDVCIDDMELVEREKRIGTHTDGLFKRRVLIYLQARQFGRRPKVGEALTLDGCHHYRVISFTDEDGVYAIELQENRV